MGLQARQAHQEDVHQRQTQPLQHLPMPKLRMSVVLDLPLAERACSHHWRLGGRVLGVPVKDQPV
jgi:hypothetical protein